MAFARFVRRHGRELGRLAYSAFQPFCRLTPAGRSNPIDHGSTVAPWFITDTAAW